MKMEMKKKTLLGTSAAVLLIVIALVLLVHRGGPPASNEPAPAIAVATVRTGTVEETIDLVGRAGPAAGAQDELAFGVAGILKSVDVGIGQRVVEGEVLARLDATPYALAAAQAGADAQAARAQEANARIDRVTVKLRADEDELRRQRVLLGAGVVAVRDVQAAEATVAADRAEASSAQQELAAATAQAASAGAYSSSATYDLSRTTLRAPADGVVAAISAQPGQSVDAVTPVVAIAPVDRNAGTLDVPTMDISRIAVGDVVHITASGAAFDARVSGIGTAGNTAGLAVVGLSGLPSSLPAGTPIDGSVVYGHAEGLVVPASSIVQDPQSGAALVFVEHQSHGGQSFTARHIIVGAQSARTAIVFRGLRAGEHVAVTGAIDLLSSP